MTAIELFCCSGGMAEGFRRAGLEFALAVDTDPDACASYEANLRRRPIRMDARDFLRLVEAGWRPIPALDLLVADPPCTPWSFAGKRLGLDDERDMVRTTCALIAALCPCAYLIGNVPGLDAAPNARAVQSTIGRLNRAGYCVRDCASFDAADFGVPQHRVRPFWFGHRCGPCIDWPVATHTDPRSLGPELPGCDTGLRPWVTCREALGHLASTELGHQARITVRPHDHAMSRPDRPVRTITRNRYGNGSVLLVPWLDAPATTITADPRLEPPGHHESVRTERAIVLSERAAARLQGFPDGWVFAGATKLSRWSQIGQAMPPPLAEAVAKSVRQQLDRAD